MQIKFPKTNSITTAVLSHSSKVIAYVKSDSGKTFKTQSYVTRLRYCKSFARFFAYSFQ